MKKNNEPNEKELLRQIRDLLVISLRKSDVPPEVISKIVGVKPKTIKNRYPAGGTKSSSGVKNAK